MMYTSTRDKNVELSASEAIIRGISNEGGLLVPKSLPELSAERLQKLAGKPYAELASDILSDFLTDFSSGEIESCARAAYESGRFPDGVAPLTKLPGDRYMLELWHGPTCAFKDVALQLLPHLLITGSKKTGKNREIVILVATSGDTGKAALEAFRDVDGAKILVFYPKDGVSDMQKLQMATQEGKNVGVCAVKGNFDDTQSYVKQIFTDADFAEELESKGVILSSANSINWGRLVPQICYYISAYCELLDNGELTEGEEINICVPTGNFGNILAAYYAKKMGLPVKKLICASNINNVLTDFIKTGVYDRRREFVSTSSPSMDILISSNLERLLFTLSGEDDGLVADLMRQLAENGVYSVSGGVREKLESEFYAGYCDEDKTLSTIRDTFGQHSYLCDTHTAVAVAVADEYKKETGDDTKLLIASTASPYKFAGSILKALTEKDVGSSEFEQVEKLMALTSVSAPREILELRNKIIRFGGYCKKSDMQSEVRKLIFDV